jgi:uncharacterized RDD family membrane protein YckC
MESDTPSLRQQGMQALQEGNLDKATDLLARAVMADDKDNDAKALLGIAYSQKGLHAQAKRALETAVQMEPQNANYRFNLGVVLARAGEMPAAAAAYRDTLTVNPQHAQAKQKMQEFGPQLHQLLANAPRLNVPPPTGASPPPASHGAPPAAPPAAAPIGGAPIGGAPIGAPPPSYSAPQGSPTMPQSSTLSSDGPPGTIQCQYCFKFAKLGMICEFCSQPLPPPPKQTPAAPTFGGPAPTGMPVAGYAGKQSWGPADPGMGSGEGFFRRFAAMLIDGFILGLIGAVVQNVMGVKADPTTITTPQQLMEFYGKLGSVLGVNAGIQLGYFVVLTAIRGQTLGKMALGIRVVAADGEPCGFGRALLRELIGKFVSNVCLLGFLWMLWDPQQQTWHDKIGGTVVERT